MNDSWFRWSRVCFSSWDRGHYGCVVGLKWKSYFLVIPPSFQAEVGVSSLISRFAIQEANLLAACHREAQSACALRMSNKSLEVGQSDHWSDSDSLFLIDRLILVLAGVVIVVVMVSDRLCWVFTAGVFVYVSLDSHHFSFQSARASLVETVKRQEAELSKMASVRDSYLRTIFYPTYYPCICFIGVVWSFDVVFSHSNVYWEISGVATCRGGTEGVSGTTGHTDRAVGKSTTERTRCHSLHTTLVGFGQCDLRCHVWFWSIPGP